MSSLNPPRSTRPRKLVRWALFGLVVLLWLYVGFKEFYLYEAIGTFLQKLFAFLGQPGLIVQSVTEVKAGLQVSAVARYTETGRWLTHSVYWLIYCGLGLLIIHLYFRSWFMTRIALGLILGLFLVSLFIYYIGVLNHEQDKFIAQAPFRMISYRIRTLLLSPMPIVLLIPALYLLKPQNGKNQ